MKGLDKFTKEINDEVNKIKDDKKKKLIQLQADALIEHLTDVCDKEYDDLLAQDHKSFRRMWKYVTSKAKEYEIDGCAFVPDPVVYGWMDTYVGLDDKKEVEEEEKKAKESEESLNNIKSKSLTKTTTKTVTKTVVVEEQASIFDLM